MRASSIARGQRGLLASLALHGALLAGAIWLLRPEPLPVVELKAISVELIVLPPSTVPARPAGAAPRPDGTDAAALPAEPEMIHATHLLSAEAFARPGNAEARRMLETLESGTRGEQLCGIEAMEQIALVRPQWHPECVIAYVFADTSIDGRVMTAEGAAFLSGTQWYRLKFACTLADDLASVTDFAFRIGAPVSAAERDRHGLAPCQ